MRSTASTVIGAGVMLLLAGQCAAQTIFEDYKLSEGDGAPTDAFGRCIDVGGDLILVGISRDDDLNMDSGSVYCYYRPTGAPIIKLFAGDGEPGDLFGASVAYGAGVIAVGSVRDDDTEEDSGSVYLFDLLTGLQVKKLHAPDPGVEDYFGGPLAIDESVGAGVLVVGVRCDDDLGSDSGSVYVFDLGSAQQARKLTADDGATYDWFGTSVAVDAGIGAVGAMWNDNANGTDAGAVYLFDLTTGQQLRKIIAPGGSEDDNFGMQVAISGGVLAVLAPGDTQTGRLGRGSVSLFDIKSGALIEKVIPQESGGAVSFDSGLDLKGGRLAIGASTREPGAPHDRVVYVYAMGSIGAPIRYFPSVSDDHDDFGYQVTIGDSELLVGAPAFFGLSSGAVYRFALADQAEPCLADLNGDAMLDFFDVSRFLGDQPDLNQDGVFNFFDVTRFIQAYLAGCP